VDPPSPPFLQVRIIKDLQVEPFVSADSKGLREYEKGAISRVFISAESKGVSVEPVARVKMPTKISYDIRSVLFIPEITEIITVQWCPI
jgi:hypothetical protein